MITIRNATLEDAPRILEIYDYYVNNTDITFENVVWAENYMKLWKKL